MLACLLACCLLLAKPVRSTLDTKEGYKIKTGSTSSLTPPLSPPLTPKVREGDFVQYMSQTPRAPKPPSSFKGGQSRFLCTGLPNWEGRGGYRKKRCTQICNQSVQTLGAAKDVDGEQSVDMDIEEVVSSVKDKPDGSMPCPDSACQILPIQIFQVQFLVQIPTPALI